MITSKKYLFVIVIATLGSVNLPFVDRLQPVNMAFASADDKEDEHGKDDRAEDRHEEAGTVHLTPDQIRTAGIVVSKLSVSKVGATITAAGEVQLNDYRTIKITPRVSAQIIERHARLGDNVVVDQPLVTLSSVEVAKAQGDLLVAEREWHRVKSLGREVVSDKRYTEARVNRDQARARVHAYGMSDEEVNELLDGKKEVVADGTFSLIATQSGRVLYDDFVIGERVDPGRVLMVIADESIMWVEARVSPTDAAEIASGNSASILIGKDTHSATVSQINHTIDESTRTLAVRIEVNNPDDLLHPGQFVNVSIQTNEITQALTVPEASVLRSLDGDWQVLIELDEPGEFKAVEVELERVVGGNAIITGLAPGTSVVTQGAFFVQSELAKSGFEVHNH